MANPNKMGMSEKQLRASQAVRFSKSAEARSKRVKQEMDENGMNAIFDALQAGEITKEQAVEQMKSITGID